MSAARKQKKLFKHRLTLDHPHPSRREFVSGKGAARLERFDRLWNKRMARDPFYLVGQMLANAPVKYARCATCVGRPHHPPAFAPMRLPAA
jgi:hypothetical protein